MEFISCKWLKWVKVPYIIMFLSSTKCCYKSHLPIIAIQNCVGIERWSCRNRFFSYIYGQANIRCTLVRDDS